MKAGVVLIGSFAFVACGQPAADRGAPPDDRRAMIDICAEQTRAPKSCECAADLVASMAGMEAVHIVALQTSGKYDEANKLMATWSKQQLQAFDEAHTAVGRKCAP